MIPESNVFAEWLSYDSPEDNLQTAIHAHIGGYLDSVGCSLEDILARVDMRNNLLEAIEGEVFISPLNICENMRDSNIHTIKVMPIVLAMNERFKALGFSRLDLYRAALEQEYDSFGYNRLRYIKRIMHLHEE